MSKITMPLTVAAIALAGCAGERVGLSKSQEDIAKVEVLKTAKDPDSVEFSGRFAAGHRINYTLLCGWANGKNGFGGHVGWTLVAVMFPDNGTPPGVMAWGEAAEIQCALANAKPEAVGVSEALMKKHGIGPASESRPAAEPAR